MPSSAPMCPMSDDALPFTKQVRQHAGVFDRDLMREIGQLRTSLPGRPALRVTLPLTTIYADAKSLRDRGFFPRRFGCGS